MVFYFLPSQYCLLLQLLRIYLDDEWKFHEQI